MAFEWDERIMGTGVPSIDRQHQELLGRMKELFDADFQGKGKEEVRRMLEFLGVYVKEHFAHEEALMAHHGCPAAERNRQAHAAFLKEYVAMTQRYDREGPTSGIVLEVATRLLNWLVSHIQACDTELKACVEREAA